MSPISFIFVDGMGIGENSSLTNPFLKAETPFFDLITNNYGFRKPFGPIIQEWFAVMPTDACLHVSGLPQSATGQTALMTGINAPLLTGRHISGYPTHQLREMIASTNIIQTSLESGYSTFLVNAYSPEYFDIIETGKRKHAAVALTAIAAGVSFCTLEDIVTKGSIYQDVTNLLLQARGHNIPLFQPEEAGKIYASIMKRYDFSVFEYFQTDAAGHKKDMNRAVDIIETLDSFFFGILNNLDLENDVLIISSDHGNIEDISTGTHTRNPVPTIIIGESAMPYVHTVKDITDISFLIRQIMFRSQNLGG